MRHKKDGISLSNVVHYRMSYCKLANTKQQITSEKNYNNKRTFTRRAYEVKEQNISIRFYTDILNKIIKLNNDHKCKDEITKVTFNRAVYEYNLLNLC